MLQVYNCLTTEHDLRLVALAGTVCLLASIVAISLFQSARAAAAGQTRFVWLTLDAAAVGFGIWATHFIAMLAYDPGAGMGYDLGLTVVSLVIAILITGAGLGLALLDSRYATTAIGGAIVGLGVAAMHYTGMMALNLPGRISWSPGLVIASIIVGSTLGTLSLLLASRRDRPGDTFIAGLLLTLAIVGMHFTGMGAVTFTPDPTISADLLGSSPVKLSLVIAAAAAVILVGCLIAALFDRQSKEQLRQQKLLLDAALENMSQGLCMFDSQGVIQVCNERYGTLVGTPATLLKGRTLLDLIRQRKADGEISDDPEEFVERVMTAAREGRISTRVVETSTGRSLRIVEQPMKDGGGWVATLEDITEWCKAQAQISHMARHDALTDLPNRTLFREQLEHALRRVSRNEMVAVLCMDLDQFKGVNDSLGHPIGDDLLKAVARRLDDCLREGDTVSRLGGDEFAIVQAGAGLQLKDVSSFAGRIVELVSAPYDIHGHQIVIGVSIGISVAPDDGVDPDQLLKNADLAMYRAKIDGRGTFRFFEGGMDIRAQARRLLELDLRAALMREEFEVYYQPIHSLADEKILSFEALVRWNHPLRGLIAPMDFIPLAEETGLIIPIGDWVLHRACKDAAGWSRPVHVAVNLSPAQFKNRDLVASVASALAAAGLSARRLELEITESVLLQDNASTLATLHKLRALGVRISMDDFGTGYSSLSYLRSFPFDKIKIDRSFVRELATRGDSMAIVRAVTGLGKSLGIPTTAEGVETMDQIALLRSEGCDEVQGFHYSPPRPAADVEKMLSGGRLRIVA